MKQRHDVDSASRQAGSLNGTQPYDDWLRLLLEKTGDMVWTVDLSMRPTYISSSLQHHLGYIPEEAMQVKMEDIFTPESYQRAMKLLAEEVARDKSTTTDPDRTRTLEVDLIHKDGHLVPVEVCYSGLRDPSGEMVEIVAVGRNITERRQIEEQNRETTRRLVQALQDTVLSLASLCEMRDPYTAGHQRRVANLACAIAVRMGQTHDMVEGLCLAGLIHDIGKVRVPAEILGSTRRLSSAEFEIVKTHPTIGYEVLHDISFPWPIAETVYQHHERLDGSGYPRGLKGNRIITEARILGVADVVEAIASERPYRKALGIQAALERIAGEKDRLFDPEVVDACLEVFRKDGYMLGQEPLLEASEDH